MELTDTQIEGFVKEFNLNFSPTAANRRLKPYDVTGDGLTLQDALTYNTAIRNRYGLDIEDLYYAIVDKQV